MLMAYKLGLADFLLLLCTGSSISRRQSPTSFFRGVISSMAGRNTHAGNVFFTSLRERVAHDTRQTKKVSYISVSKNALRNVSKLLPEAPPGREATATRCTRQGKKQGDETYYAPSYNTAHLPPLFTKSELGGTRHLNVRGPYNTSRGLSFLPVEPDLLVVSKLRCLIRAELLAW